MPERVVVVGGGVGGLASALALGRAGHPVTLVDRDPLVVAEGPEAAFAAARQGAPQVHHTHGFLARLVVVLRERFPDVLDDLLAAGCTTMPMTMNLGEPMPGDEDLALLIVRRTTFDWVLRRAVLAEAGVEVRTGTGVAGLVASPGPPANGNGDTPGVPRVAGVRLEDGRALDADVVVASTGRRSSVPTWLGGVGVDVAEVEHGSGLVYLSRWYRLPAGTGVPIDARLFGDLGYVKFLAVPGDARTLSITLAVRSGDADLRSALSAPGGFERACSLIPGPDQFFAHGPIEPLGPVRPMGGLVNRLRRFLDADGQPVVAGFHAVGDAHTCTNPLYGRGCSLAFVQAVALADAAAAHPGDPLARARAYEAACAEEVEPWFHVSVEMDRLGSDPSAGGSTDGAVDADAGKGMRALTAAAATDPVLGRPLARFWNLLTTPAGLATDPAFAARAAAVMADPDAHPVPARPGPTRAELLADSPAA